VSVFSFFSTLAGNEKEQNITLKKTKMQFHHLFVECNLAIPSEKVQDLATKSTEKVNCALTELRRLFLVRARLTTSACLSLLPEDGHTLN
jgi:hypothetical protein